jgi:hypothetical protein
LVQVHIELFARELTFWKDRLVAISGIARLFCEQNHLEDYRNELGQYYLAGIWWKDIEQQLLWYRLGYELAPRPPDPYAPSWSWASVDGQIFLPLEVGTIARLTFKVLEARVAYATEDVFGPVTGGSLRLRCNPLIPVAIKPRDASSRPHYFLVVNNRDICAFIAFDAVSIVERKDIFALHGGMLTEKDWTEKHCGLLLEPLERRDTFRRVGFFYISDFYYDEELLGWKKVTSQSDETIESNEETNKIIIEIV